MFYSSKASRYTKNPILLPTNNKWENQAVFNCASVYSESDNTIKILYRAMGDDRISRLGLAESKDGYTISKRFDEPVLLPECDMESLGIEDPRITQIGDVYYITYVAASLSPESAITDPYKYGAKWQARTCLASTTDFVHFDRLGCILPNVDNKDVVLFPEKIGGKYVMLHRIFPSIWIATSDDLLHWSDHRILFEPSKSCWDCNRIGAGAPPVKTEHGWLNIYHGVDNNMVYSLGAFLLDLEDPTKMLYRDTVPILEPDTRYERIGQTANVCFTCGVIPDGDCRYAIYYGAADKVIGLAHYSFQKL